MKSYPRKSKEERRVYDLFARILIIRLITLPLMILPAVWKNSGAIGARLFYALWALGGAVIFATAIYGIVVEVKTKVAAFTYLGISPARFDSNPLIYLVLLLVGATVALISGVFIYGCFIALGQ